MAERGVISWTAGKVGRSESQLLLDWALISHFRDNSRHGVCFIGGFGWFSYSWLSACLDVEVEFLPRSTSTRVSSVNTQLYAGWMLYLSSSVETSGVWSSPYNIK